MRNREKIKGNATVMDLIVLMSEGNPGAATVLSLMAQRNPLDILNLDDMNMRGPQIWVGFKDFAKEDLDVFIAACKKRSRDMVEEVNKWCLDDCGEAVTSGASFKR